MQKRKPTVPGLAPRHVREQQFADIMRAKTLFQKGDDMQREGAQILTDLHNQGLSTQKIANVYGASKTWVHMRIKWCEGGFQDETPFGPASKRAREKKKKHAAQTARGPDGITEPVDNEDENNAAEDDDNNGEELEDTDADDDHDESEGEDDEDDGSDGIWPQSDTSAPVELCSRFDKVRRRGLIESLENLGSKDERARLEAARSVVQYQNGTGVAWNVLLIPAYENRKR